MRENYTCVLTLGTQRWEDPDFQASLKKWNSRTKRDGEQRRDGEGRMGKVQGRRGKRKVETREGGKERAEQSRVGQGRVADPRMVPRSHFFPITKFSTTIPASLCLSFLICKLT